MKEIYARGVFFSIFETITVSYYGIIFLFDTPERAIATSRGSQP